MPTYCRTWTTLTEYKHLPCVALADAARAHDPARIARRAELLAYIEQTGGRYTQEYPTEFDARDGDDGDDNTGEES